MSVTHSTGAKVALATAARAYFNAGSGSLQAIEFQKADDTVLASVPLASTPFAVPNGSGVMAATIPAPGTSSVASGGTATKGRVKDKDGNVCVFFSVGTSAADINFDAVIWALAATITLTSFNYQVS